MGDPPVAKGRVLQQGEIPIPVALACKELLYYVQGQFSTMVCLDL